MAEFADADALVDAAQARARRRLSAASKRTRRFRSRASPKRSASAAIACALITLLGGIAGGVGGYFLQWYTAVIDYPINAGGRPLHSWPAFIPATFEMTVLGAALAAFFGMLIAERPAEAAPPGIRCAGFRSRVAQPLFPVHRRRPIRVRSRGDAARSSKRSSRCASREVPRRDARDAPVDSLPALALSRCRSLLGGCEKAMQDMYNQPRYKPLAASALWRDGRSARPDVAGHDRVQRRRIAGTSSGRLGELPLPQRDAPTYPVDEHGRVKANLRRGSAAAAARDESAADHGATLQRGRERFDIYCSPCHSVAGDGDGMVVRRGFPHPPSYHTDRLRNAPDAHFYRRDHATATA